MSEQLLEDEIAREQCKLIATMTAQLEHFRWFSLLLIILILAISHFFVIDCYRIVLLSLSVSCGLIIQYLSLRVALDSDIFFRLANTHKIIADQLTILDHAMEQLGWVKTKHSQRDITQRIKGVIRVIIKLSLFMILQLILMILFIVN